VSARGFVRKAVLITGAGARVGAYISRGLAADGWHVCIHYNSSGACIINVIDQRVLKPNPQFFTYSLAKAGLYWATKTMAQSFAPNIRVNGIGPGPTLENTGQGPGEFDAEVKATLLGEGSPPETILHGIRYLLSAKSVTGQMIAVDGGQHLVWQTPDLAFGGTP